MRKIISAVCTSMRSQAKMNRACFRLTVEDGRRDSNQEGETISNEGGYAGLLGRALSSNLDKDVRA